MAFISARIISVVVDDAIPAQANAGPDQSALCIVTITLEGNIDGDLDANHTFEWEQTFGDTVTLDNPNSLTPSFVNSLSSDIEFTFFVDRNTPFEDSDTVFISNKAGTRSIGIAVGTQASVSTNPGVAIVNKSSISSELLLVDNVFVTGAAYTNPLVRYSPIYKAEDLDRVRENLLGSYMLMNDVDLSSNKWANWNPIGDSRRPFRGTFDGNGFTINNLTITSSIRDSGLFGTVSGAIIEHLGVTNANVTGQTSSFYSSILVGSVLSINATTIKNCYTTGDVDAEGDRGGGFIGNPGTNNSTIYENNYADVTVTNGTDRVGGFLGFFESEPTYIENYSNTTKTALIVGTVAPDNPPAAGEIEGRSTAQLNVEANYTNWNFVSRWEIDEGNSPAALQDKASNRIRRGGFCDDQWMIAWNNPADLTTAAKVNNYIFKGVIAEERLGSAWAFPRFIPREQNSVLMTPDIAHRISAVWDRSNISGNIHTPKNLKEVIIIESLTFTSRNSSSGFGPYGNTSVVYYGAMGISSQPIITIVNPRKIGKSVFSSDYNSLTGSIASSSSIITQRFIGATKNASDTIALITIGNSPGPKVTPTITRLTGLNIG